MAPSAGIKHRPVDRDHRRARERPGEAVVQSAIETADIGAKTASAAHASSGVGSAAISSSTTAPVPARPCSRPMPNACARRAQPAVVVVLAVAVQPADEHAQREQHDDHADGLLGGRARAPAGAPCRAGSAAGRSASSAVAWPAPHTAPRRAAERVPLGVPGDQRRDRHEVVGVGRVAQAEQERDAERDDERRALEEAGEGVVDRLRSSRAASQSRAGADEREVREVAREAAEVARRRAAAPSRSSSGTCFPQRSHAA